MSHAGDGQYYIPEPSRWPVIAGGSLLLLLCGTALAINGVTAFGGGLILCGFLLVAWFMYGWFGDVVRESMGGSYNAKVDRSFRQGMFWFIASEVFFFVSFFGALFYIRNIAVPWLGGAGYLGTSNEILYDQFTAHWPTAGPGNLGGGFTAMSPWGVPAINTLILLSSGVTITWAHWGLKLNKQKHLIWGLIATVALGAIFLALQVVEYHEGYKELNLTLESGVYGSTFYMLTGFHGMHVTLGAIMLAAILGRSLRGHFNPENHFAFEAVAWYWHFVDVVWLGLFIFVYWL